DAAVRGSRVGEPRIDGIVRKRIIEPLRDLVAEWMDVCESARASRGGSRPGEVREEARVRARLEPRGVDVRVHRVLAARVDHLVAVRLAGAVEPRRTAVAH